MSELLVFDPVDYSDEENAWLLEHLGEPTLVARRAITFPINPSSVMPLIERVNELEAQQLHDGSKWIGIEAIKASIKVWQAQNRKWDLDNQRNRKAPRWPSLYSYDAKGRPHRGGPGSDSGKVKTYFGPAGERIPFAINLLPDEVLPWEAPGFTEQSMSPGLFVDAEKNRIECKVKVGDGICGHTESYKAESRASYSAARARMSKHLRKATENKDDHIALHTDEFGE